MSGNFGGYDPRSYIESLVGPNSQEPKWPATLEVGGLSLEQSLRERRSPVSLPTPPWEPKE